MSVARNIMLLVTFSQASVRCSPMKASWKPSLSARMIASRSSCSVCDQSRPNGCTGMVKEPNRIYVSDPIPVDRKTNRPRVPMQQIFHGRRERDLGASYCFHNVKLDRCGALRCLPAWPTMFPQARFHEVSQPQAERLGCPYTFTGILMLRWFHALMPKEERFFDLFARHSEAVLGGAQALRAMMEGGEAVASNCQTVMDREHDADDATREVLIAVRRTFITPFDRGSIRDLITSMDNSIDQMQKTAKSIRQFEVTKFTAQMREMGDHIV